MQTHSRGITTVGVLVVVVVLAIIGFAIAYYGSDVFRTKAKASVQQFAEWTPENIAKDPLNYLNFCEEQAKGALEKCKASEIAIAQKKAKIESMRDEAKNSIAIGTKALDELTTLYKDADAKAAFPIKWKSTELDKELAKRQIMKLAGQIKSRRELLTKLESAIEQLRIQSNKLAEAKDNAKDQLVKIDTNREMLKVHAITDELKSNLVAMKAAIETSVVGLASSDAGSLSLDDLAAQAETAVDEAEFNKILQNN
jgi:Tfp pilus assembly protein PilE